ncbi:MAG: UDP-N-acetylmuramoyl-tripeptide--D-alanyl-D-alanine ligase [Pseudomonadota bacterium]
MAEPANCDPLWTWDELVSAAGGVADGPAPSAPLTDFSIDTRELTTGNVFIALKSARDGHNFVPTAFENGAAAAIVDLAYSRQPGDGALLRVPDTLRALEAIGRSARARLSAAARVVAITGSAGKTTTKELLRTLFQALDVGHVHWSVKSFNNHWGVPLTLARMPRTTRFAVFEIGMNHAEEIRPLTKMVQPHIAVVTTIAPAHLGNFAHIEDIADAKSEIFDGLQPGGTAILPQDNPHFARLRKAAQRVLSPSGDIRTFGESGKATLMLTDFSPAPSSSRMTLGSGNNRMASDLSLPGKHNAFNALAALIALRAAAPVDDGTFARTAQALGQIQLTPHGRGQVTSVGGITLIDESYNANPASMAAALGVLGLPRDGVKRRIAILGDMLELGEISTQLHSALAEPIAAAGVDTVHCAGPHMRALHDALPQGTRGHYASDSATLAMLIVPELAEGDVVMVKGSLGSKMAQVVTAIQQRFA